MKARFPSVHHSRQPAFTLIELLAVIGIVLVLAALIFGVSKTVLQKTQRAGSLGHLKAISSLAAMYMADHEDYAVPFRTYEWDSAYKNMAGSYMFEFLPAQYGDKNFQVFRRPGDDLTYMGGAGTRSYKGVVVWSYARNLSLPRRNDRSDLSIKRVTLPEPSKTMMFMETIQNGGIHVSDASVSHVYFDQTGDKGRCAIAYLDGHAALLSRDAMGLKADGSADSLTAEERTLWFGFPNVSTRVEN